VLVMDVDRLGRGNMQDQGLILDTFKNSKTKIITPRKIYDLSDEFDEEYTEFESFMARKELKLINRRLQRGRVKSIEEGKYISPDPPYGYTFIYDDKGKKQLAINDEQSKAVKLIFDMYLEGNGTTKIATRLNYLGYRTNNQIEFKPKAVRDILSNITYTGYVKWKTVNRKNFSRTRPLEEQTIALGNHEAIIDEETYKRAQEIRQSRYISPAKKEVSNPLAGLVICRKCGHNIIKKVSREKEYLTCRHCDNRSTSLDYIEKAVINSLEQWLKDYKIKIEPAEDLDKMDSLNFELKKLEKELKENENQKNKLFDLLERGIYDEETFLERSLFITSRIKNIKNEIDKVNFEITSFNKNIIAKQNIIPDLESVLEHYYSSSPKEQNMLLKSVIDKVLYEKSQDCVRDDFDLEIYPK
ncbi:MAG: recombinase family protein, partial [Terrisporobacter sp.]